MNHMSCQNWKKREREIREIILSKIINITEIYRKVFNGSEQFYIAHKVCPK